jgi:phosphate starvation-inducible PhoH-like protein
VEGVAFIRLERGDIVRHPLVQRIVEAYDAHASAEKGRGTAEPSPEKERGSHA